MSTFYEQEQILFPTGWQYAYCYSSHESPNRTFVQHTEMFQHLSTEAEQILNTEYGEGGTAVSWQRPHDAGHGDLTTTVALQLAKKLGKNPREIAQVLADKIALSPSVEKAEVAGAGYVNVWLTAPALMKALDEASESVNAKKPNKKDDPVIIEYSQPNIAKPLGIHHIIGTVLGQSLVNLYRHDGSNVIAWNYLGDWGTQFGKLAVAHQKWGTKKSAKDYTLDDLLALYVQFHQELEKDASLEDEGREAFRKLEQGDKELRSFWKDVVSVTKASLEDLYKKLHVSFDLDLGESFYEDKMDGILEEGKKKKVFVEGEGGSLIVKFDDENMPPYLVQKGDGATLYSTRDIAQMRYRMDEYHPQKILICTDIAQKLHFEQLAETCKQLGWELPAFENVLFGRMRFADKSMSTRKGNILKLEHVIEESIARADEVIKERGDAIQTDDPKDLAEMMGVGALVYGILSQNRKMDMVFDWDKMLSFEGNSAPYLQYTHARAKSVLRKSEEAVGELTVKDGHELSKYERILIGTLLQFPHVLEEARREHLPHKVANYLYQLAQDFNGFYNSEQILKAEGDVRLLRLSLTSRTADILKAGAALLTLRVPERM